MDRNFLKEIQADQSIRLLSGHIRRIAGRQKGDKERRTVLSELMQVWIAISGAAGREAGPDGDCDERVLRIASLGGKATHDAILLGGEESARKAAAHLVEFFALDLDRLA